MSLPTIPPIKPVPNLPEFRWNEAAQRYIDQNGNFVSQERIRGELDLVMDGISVLMGELGSELLDGSISLAKYKLEMMKLIKQSHIIGASMNAGGWFQMTQSDWGKVGNIIKKEYGYLQNFVSDIASGTQQFNGHVRRISRLFGQKGRLTYYDYAKSKRILEGFDLEASELTPADHCEECVAEAARGFVKMGTLKPIGERICRSNCKCLLYFKNSSTGEIILA